MDEAVIAPEVPGYRLERFLGSGGFSAVWAASSQKDGSPVAIKVSQAATPTARRRLAGEAAALSRVGPPHVPALHDQGTLTDGRPYLVMEQLTGDTLGTRLGKLAAVPDLTWVRAISDAVLASLEVVHAAGLVHGDLKPENILLSGETSPRAVLIDFGVTRPGAPRGAGDTTSLDDIVASAEYMAPEVFERGVDTRADIYSAGVLLYELITLRVPFVGDTASIRHGHRALRPPPPGAFASVPAPLEELCLACLAKEPDRRPRDVATVRHQLACAIPDNATRRLDTSAPSQHRSASRLTNSRQPVILLAVELDAASRRAEQVIRHGKGVIAQQRGGFYVCGFSGLEVEEPVTAALAVARELVERHRARAVVHLAPLKVRRRRGQPTRLYGPALASVTSWLPPERWRGLLLTAKVAAVLPDVRTRPAPALPGFCELAPQPAPAAHDPALPAPADPPLVGRDDVLGRAVASLRGVLASANPGLFTTTGDSGLGKTRLARELADLARRTCPEATVLTLRALRRGLDRPEPTVRAMLDLLAEHGAIERPVAALDEAAAARLAGDGLRSAASARPLALIIDDLHHADGAALDAIEYATLDGEDVALWIAVTAHPHLRRRRPQWGVRAHDHTAVELTPLPETASMRLLAELLRPAEYPPAATLRRLSRWAAGSPHSLAELARTLKREGIVRKRLRSESWYVATAELDRLPASPAEQWLAARQLGALPAELAAYLRVCAVLGVELSRDELAWVQDAAQRAGTASSAIDTDVGLRELARLGFIEEEDGAWTFGQAALQAAVYKLVGSRERRQIHHDALLFWRHQAGEQASDRVLAAIARHAGGCEAGAEAADAHLELGDRARGRHRDIDADQHYTAALLHIDAGDHERRIRALGGRGRVRYRVQRTREAIEDLSAARQHAAALGRDRLIAELLLEEATALDWEWRFVESAARVAKARPLVEAARDTRLNARYWNALGRCHHRRDSMFEAIENLSRANALAAACGDVETRIIGLLLLATDLTYVERQEEAAARFDEVIALCEQTGDRLHLCAAYSNRGLLWLDETSLPLRIHDLRQAVRLARELGQPILERIAAHNLAELLYRGGKHEEALALARRAYALQRFLPQPVPPDALLLARIHAALDQHDEARAQVMRVHTLAATHPLTELERLALAMLEQALAEADGTGDAGSWDELTAEARRLLPGDELLEHLHVRARAAQRAARWDEVDAVVAEAAPLLDEHPVWRRAFAGVTDRPLSRA